MIWEMECVIIMSVLMSVRNTDGLLAQRQAGSLLLQKISKIVIFSLQTFLSYPYYIESKESTLFRRFKNVIF